MREYDRFVLLELLPMLGILLVCREIYTSKLSLNDKAPLVRRKGDINFDGIFDSIRVVDFLEELLLIASKANVVELFGSG